LSSPQNIDQDIKTHYRACHLCEAICGLEIKTKDDEIVSIKGDKNDPISQGYICPKATAIADIHNDPDRLRKPVKKVGNEWQEISWEEAIEMTAERLVSAQQTHGDNAVGFYAGNPGVHNYGNMTHGPVLRRAVKTRNNFSATSLDQLPHQLVAYAMYGHQFCVPIPDIDRTDLMVIFGGNPMASNGSLMTVPNIPKRFKELKKRGGQLIVVDPRYTETAEVADQHHFIKPATDAYVLLAMINTLFKEQWIRNTHLDDRLEGLGQVKAAVSDFTLELAEAQSGVAATTIKQLTKKLSQTERSVIYGRMGVSVQQFGALCQWAIQVINILIGATDRIGGALLTSPAFGYIRKGSSGAGHFNVFQSRVSGLPEFAGELPAVVMAEEMLTPGDGQIKSMVTIAGNPIISSTNSNELNKAFAGLDFYVALDFYINATTRHADVILPPTSPLEHDHYDIAFLRLAVRNSTRYNPAIFKPADGALHDWQIFNALAQKISELKKQDFKPLPAPHLLIDQGLQSDHYGAAQNPDLALNLEKLTAAPHGIDLGPLVPGLGERLCTVSDKINCAPEFIIEDVARLKENARTNIPEELLLIGRRHVRSNNSWMHNYHRLVKGKPRWQLMMHPQDLADRGIADQTKVTIKSRVGSVITTVVASDKIMRGVVSLPHGWGHNKAGVKMGIASQQEGVNCNELTDDKLIDTLSGNAALNGVPVQVSAA